MTTTLHLNGEDIEISVMEGKDVADDEAVLQVVRRGRVITTDPHGYTIEGSPPVLDPDFCCSPLTNLQRALLVP